MLKMIEVGAWWFEYQQELYVIEIDQRYVILMLSM